MQAVDIDVTIELVGEEDVWHFILCACAFLDFFNKMSKLLFLMWYNIKWDKSA